MDAKFSSSVRSHHAIPSNHPCHAMLCHAMYLFSYSPFPFRSISISISVSVRPSPPPLMPFPMPFFSSSSPSSSDENRAHRSNSRPSLGMALMQRTDRTTMLDGRRRHTYLHTYHTYIHGRTHHVCNPIPSHPTCVSDGSWL